MQGPVSEAAQRQSTAGVAGAAAGGAGGTSASPLVVAGFDASDLPALRATVRETAKAVGLGSRRVADFVLAVHELAANSVMHGGGRGELRLWLEDDALVCEVRDRGELFETAALAARREARHGPRTEGGYGLWIVRQACDSTEIRQVRGRGTVVRVAIGLAPVEQGGQAGQGGAADVEG